MKRTVGRGTAKLALVASGAALALIVSSLVAAQPGGSSQPRGRAAAPRGAVSRATATAALRQFMRQGWLAPGQRSNRPARRVGGLTQVSFYNWSGYADAGRKGTTFTAVSGSWTQPAVTCVPNENELAVFWVGLDGVSDVTVEQDGTLALCLGGTASYFTWWETAPKALVEVGKTVAPGDDIAASVTFASSMYALAVTDSTHTADSFSVSEACGAKTCKNSSAEWIAETPDTSRGFAPWPDFATWNLSSASVTGSGTTGVISSFRDDEVTMVTNDGYGNTLATPGSLNGTGNGFADTWDYTW